MAGEGRAGVTRNDFIIIVAAGRCLAANGEANSF